MIARTAQISIFSAFPEGRIGDLAWLAVYNDARALLPRRHLPEQAICSASMSIALLQGEREFAFFLVRSLVSDFVIG
ncbi:hypothetical protein [Herbaspirillum hiltneri]|uniref:hypothetical protein n=1 Tax=Herbaspirillum hiltneri TaxID=341045 RepID=UPI0011874BD4|nr:hypothetical protein [Herbaspirillum hiltneri]